MISPVTVGINMADIRLPLLTESKSNLSCKIFARKGVNADTNITETEMPSVRNRNVVFVKRYFNCGMNSLIFASFVLSAFLNVPSLMCFCRLSLAPGKEEGNPRITTASTRNNKPNITKPSHHAPIQRGSFGVSLTPSG